MTGPVVALGAEGAEHRHHRGDAAAAAHEQEAVGAGGRQRERTVCGGQADDQAHGGVVLQVAADGALGVGLHGELEGAGVLSGRRHRVAARVADPVDLDGELGELPGGEAGPVAVGTDGQGDAVGGAVADLGDPAPHLGGRPCGDDQLEVAVDAVRRGEGVEPTDRPLEEPPGGGFS